MKSRKDLPFLLNRLGLTDMGVEVGVAAGNYSRHILKHWNGKRLNMVDPYAYQGAVLDRSDDELQHAGNELFAHAVVLDYKYRAALHKEFSVKAASHFFENELDFVYIDARHDFRSVWADLAAWYPKVKVGGIIAGHDYKNSFVRKNLVEVKRAVDKFFLLTGEKIHVTSRDNLPTFYVQKQNV